MKENELIKIGEWLNTKGYDIDFTDDLWMEDVLHDHKFKDLCELMGEYAREQAEQAFLEGYLQLRTLNVKELKKQFKDWWEQNKSNET